MSLIIANDTHYICYSSDEEIKKTDKLEEASIFPSINQAVKIILKSQELYDFYVYDTITRKKCWSKPKRKRFTKNQRKIIYNNSGGRCALCGRRIEFEKMSLDHIVPLSSGGSDSMENLQCTCLPCNEFKKNILPEDFLERITSIFLFQMQKKLGEKYNLTTFRNILSQASEN